MPAIRRLVNEARLEIDWEFVSLYAGSIELNGIVANVREGRVMVRLFVRHEVADYGPWRAAYNDFDEERRSMGVIGAAVYRSVSDGNDVTIYHDFQTMDAAQAFVGSARLREVMEKAGVSGQPDIWFVEEA